MSSPCANCGNGREQHWLANFADGPHIGAPLLVCPTATWREADEGMAGLVERLHAAIVKAEGK
jgi:hypothetical protein